MNLDLRAANYAQKVKEFEAKYSNFESKVEILPEPKEVNYTGNFLQAKDIWEDIVAKLNTNQFYALSALGGQGSGKSTLGKEFADLAIQNDFKFIYALPEDFLNDIDSWIGKILEDPKEYNCIMLDDLSYSNDMQSRKNQAAFKNVVARIRHLFTEDEEYKDQSGLTSSKVFIIYVTHRLHAAPPMLRNSGSWIFTEMQSADRDDALEVLGRNKELRERLDQIYTFLNQVVFTGAKEGKIKYDLDGKSYNFKWGKQNDPGDGRLMAIFHAGQISIYNTKLPKTKINFNDYRFKRDIEEVENLKFVPGQEVITFG